MAFSKLALTEPVLKALAQEGYTTPTPIQQQAIPFVLQQRDLLGCAQTGTGKTAAFAIPILELLQAQKPLGPGIKVLILTPTRELAIQIDESFAAYGRYTGIRHTVIFGGVSQHAQVNALRQGVDVLVATPGRLLDLMQQGFIRLDQLQIFVLDEADRMLDMGFIHDVKKVIAKLPAKRQTLFFSATMPPEIQKLADMLLTNPAKVEVTPPATTVEKIEQRLYFVAKKEKPDLLLHLLQNPEIKSTLVFTRTKHGADKVARMLHKHQIQAAAIHGNKSQNARQAALAGFKNGAIRVLVATDIAARGIDIDELAHVINFDLPDVPETYVHRIGRTGRAGNSGLAISFCAAEEKDELRAIQKLIVKTLIVVEDHPYTANAHSAAPPKEERQRPGFRQQNEKHHQQKNEHTQHRLQQRPAHKPQQGQQQGQSAARQQRPAQQQRSAQQQRPAQQQQRPPQQSQRPAHQQQRPVLQKQQVQRPPVQKVQPQTGDTASKWVKDYPDDERW
ncbi:MAG: DEAD/DEAH box helicase [Chitinophagales bacterium]|nr:DEAD/DEAH box helicase [Chitinophagales bacterium]